MEPVSPVIDGFAELETVYAKDQPQYKPLPALVGTGGKVLTRWRPTEEERQAIADGGDIFLMVWTFRQPLQPVRLIVACPKDLAEMAEEIGLI